jgi:uncharacterized membrane protein YwzB
MKKHEKWFLGIFVGVAVVNFYLQYRTSKKMEEIKKSIVQR